MSALDLDLARVPEAHSPNPALHAWLKEYSAVTHSVSPEQLRQALSPETTAQDLPDAALPHMKLRENPKMLSDWTKALRKLNTMFAVPTACMGLVSLAIECSAENFNKDAIPLLDALRTLLEAFRGTDTSLLRPATESWCRTAVQHGPLLYYTVKAAYSQDAHQPPSQDSHDEGGVSLVGSRSSRNGAAFSGVMRKRGQVNERPTQVQAQDDHVNTDEDGDPEDSSGLEGY